MVTENKLHPRCVKCNKLIMNSTNQSRKYCFECRQLMLKVWGKQDGQSNKTK